MTKFCVNWALLLVLFCSVGYSADLPDKLKSELADGRAAFEAKWKEAQEGLVSAFDKEITNARAATKLTGEEKQNAIGSLEAEKAIFDKSNTIPFSPRMRNSAIHYLNAVQKAESTLSKIYDRAIEHLTKQKDDEGARDLVAEKKKLLEPKLAAKWIIKGEGGVFNHILYSNGQTSGGTWTLDHKHLVVQTPNKKAPAGVWVDTCAISEDGMKLNMINQKGHKFTGKLVVE